MFFIESPCYYTAVARYIDCGQQDKMREGYDLEKQALQVQGLCHVCFGASGWLVQATSCDY